MMLRFGRLKLLQPRGLMMLIVHYFRPGFAFVLSDISRILIYLLLLFSLRFISWILFLLGLLRDFIVFILEDMPFTEHRRKWPRIYFDLLGAILCG